MARDYKREYQLRKAHFASPAEKARRASHGRARYKMMKKLGKTALTGKDIDHKNRNAHDNSDGNLRVVSKKKNRGWRKGKSGYS